MKILASSLALILLIFGCAERKSDAYQTLQVERDTLAPVAAQLEAEKAELVAQLDALKSGANPSKLPSGLPDRVKLTLNAPSDLLELIEPQRGDDAAADALLGWFEEDYQSRGISPTNIELQADNGCASSPVLRELSAAKLYFFAQRRFWRPFRGLVLFRSMPIKDNPLFGLIATHGDHLARALVQARTQIEKTPNWQDHFDALFYRAQRNYVALEHFIEAGFPTFDDKCLLVDASYHEPARDIAIDDGSLHAELATERLFMDGDSPAGFWLYSFWLRRYGDGTMPVVSKVLDGYLAYQGGDQ